MKCALLLAMLMFSALSVSAISGNDAVNFVVSSNHFLYDEETYLPPNVPIMFEGKSYWVVPVVSGNNIVTYFPVEADSGELSISRAVNRGLFETAEQLREMQLLKNSVSSNSGVDWIFTKKYETIFNETSLQLSDEVFQLNTVETTLSSAGLLVNVSGLKSQLVSMSGQASSVSEKINSASAAENSFFISPSAQAFNEMNSSFGGVFSMISALNDSSLSYQSNVDKLKQQISVSDKIDAQTKSQIFGVLEVPQGLQALRNYNLDSTQISESISSVLEAVSLRQDSVLSEFDSRLLKNDVYALLYGENPDLVKGSSFSSLYSAQAAILAEENRGLWKDQAKVRDLEQNYSRALKLYNEKSFSESKKYAQQAVANAVSVEKQGKNEGLPPEPVSQDFLFQLAAILAVLLVLLYALNNRDKLSKKIFGQREDGEGPDFYG